MRRHVSVAGALSITPSTRHTSPFHIATMAALPSGVKSKPPGRIQLCHGFSTGSGKSSAMNAPSSLPATEVVVTVCGHCAGPPRVSGARSSGAVKVFASASSEAGSTREMKSRVCAPEGSLATQKPLLALQSAVARQDDVHCCPAPRAASSGCLASATLSVRTKTGVVP